MPSQISAKLPVMKERMTTTPLVAFEVRADRGIKGIPPPQKKKKPRGSRSTHSPPEGATDNEDRDWSLQP